ncbi:hypothetical protein [Flexistipes sp.]|uniref:hypothetical protein n=1 Tax=Flexistipes sp. TaxID=3088135 RepID=UPI002E246B40|nr:hypothetical protein [Flexistipes sp.]
MGKIKNLTKKEAVMFKTISKKGKKEKQEKEYLEALSEFRSNFPVSEGWEINTFKAKDGYITTKVQKKGNVYSQASVEREDETHTEAERRSIVEALIRFGIIPEKEAA